MSTSVVWLNQYYTLFLGSGDYTPIDMPLKINNMSTAITCVNILTIYDENPMNMDETFVVSLSSNDPKVFIAEESASTKVTIENSKIALFLRSFGDSDFLHLVFPPDVEPMINKVTQGMSAVFTVKLPNAITINGFQWQHNKNNIDSEEHALLMNLTIVNAAETDEGNYTCIVTFSSFEGSITSNRAQLLVCKLIITWSYFLYLFFLTVSSANITTHPSDKIVSEGGSVTFSVNASGDELTYQWQRNGANVPGNDSNFEGVSTAVLKIKVAEVDDAGMYRCIVLNRAGDNATSNEATLTVSK
jgi:hypothetical protein